jgi:hypothetical protein
LDAHDYVYANVETRSVYSPFLLLPQALALRYLGLSLQLPALTVYYACRLVGLLCYLILCWLAVRLIPFGKWVLAILIVSPMAIFQASTISADTISNGIGFLFLAASLAMARARALGWRQWLALLGLIALLFTAKVNLLFLVLLPFLLIFPRNFKMKYGYVWLGASALILLLIEVGGWNVLAYSKFTRALAGADPRQQLLFVASNPLLFANIIAKDVWGHTLAYLQGWVGVYGYNYWPVPALTYLLYPLAVIVATVRGDGPVVGGAVQQGPDKRTRLVLVALFIIGFLLTIVSLYIAFTPVKSLLVAGVQGRYFTVIMPLLFLAALGLGSGTTKLFGQPTAIILVLLAVFLYTGGLLLSYHVSCGAEYYSLGLCYQPQYKNWAPASVSSRPVSPALSLTQEIVPACDGMSQLSLWVNSSGTDPAGTTQLTLRAPTEQKDVVRQVFSNTAVKPGSWLTAEFAPEWRSANQLYILTLTGSSPDGLRLGYSEKPEYLAGKLYENGTALGQDILFQYGCIAGLQRLLP